MTFGFDGIGMRLACASNKAILEKLIADGPGKPVTYNKKPIGTIEEVFPDGTARIKITDPEMITVLLNSGLLEK
jgi:hypothetical protein